MPKVTMSNAKIDLAITELTGVKGNIQLKKGLISEKITIGTKNRIQKLVRKLLEHFEPYQTSKIELFKLDKVEPKDGMYIHPLANQSDEFKAQNKELDEQLCEIDFDAIDFKFLENVETEAVYDFELLAPFLENYQ